VLGSGGADSAPVRDDEQTVISNRPPVGVGSGDGPVGIESGAFKPGDMLDHYEILDYVGGGGMGRVFRAHDTQLAREVALKVLPREQAADSETILRFRNEARSAARLDHENIARVYHVGEARGLTYLVFEFVEGPTIRALVEQHGPLPLAQAVSYTLQVADALAHADQQGVVHRDIKPSNVIITDEDCVKVIDLGLARIQDFEQTANDLTASGVTLGTFDYISPEQARDPRVVDTRSDIYSLGCAFFYMLTARPPFPEGTVLQKLLQHQGDKPPDIHDFRPELPGEVQRVLQKMLAKDPSHRYQTPMELVEQLQALAEQIGLRPLGPGQRIWVAPKRPRVPLFHRHLPWIAPVAALLCIVVAMELLSRAPSATDPGVTLPKPGSLAPGSHEDFVPRLPEPDSPGSSGAPDRTPAAPNGTQASGPGRSESSAPGEPTRGGASPPATSSDATAGVADNGPATGVEGSADNGLQPFSTDSATGVSIDPALLPEAFTPADLGLPPATGPGLAAEDSTLSKSTGILTVGDVGSGASNYPTLAAACSAAQTGDIIELCYDGHGEERPLVLSNAKLVIRAGAGFRPVIRFRPDQPDTVYRRSMFTMTGGELSLLGVAVEMDIPRELPTARWVMWELGQAAQLRLRKSLLTIRNPYGHDVAVFCVKPSPMAELVGTRRSPNPLPPTEIELTDCVVRGQAVTLRAKGLQPVRLSWTNGLLVTNKWFLSALGGDREPALGEMIEVRLKHVTARVDKGLCRLDNSRFTPFQLPVGVDCADSIILVASPQGALIEQLGEYPSNLEEPDEPWFNWTGDRNCYEGSAVFWRRDDPGRDAPTGLFEFDRWQAHWAPEHEIHSQSRHVDFATPLDLSRAAHTCRVADFRLGELSENWARGGASDGTDIGAALDRLPTIPPKAKPAKPKPEPGQ